MIKAQFVQHVRAKVPGSHYAVTDTETDCGMFEIPWPPARGDTIQLPALVAADEGQVLWLVWTPGFIDHDLIVHFETRAQKADDQKAARIDAVIEKHGL